MTEAFSARGLIAPSSEINAWRDSLTQMAKVVRASSIPRDSGVAIEYGVPGTNKRVDFIITGQNGQNQPTAVIVELKQWSTATHTDKDAIIIASRGGRGGPREGTHPSYQAWSYAEALIDFSAEAAPTKAALTPCAYLHNYKRDGEIDHPVYAEHIAKAPLFFHGPTEIERLAEFIARHVRRGDRGQLLYRIEGGEIRPTQSLMDRVADMIKGNPAFVLLDDQKVVFEEARHRADEANLVGAPKQVVIVRGGPGTGKSVVAVSLLAELVKQGNNARYVSKNAAPREVYRELLAGRLQKNRITALFSGSGAFVDAEPDTFHTLIVDEAHRLNQFSGLYGNLGEHQVKELISAARCTIFFVDDDQRVTVKDVGTSSELLRFASEAGAVVTQMELQSQFRCAGSDSYLDWLDSALGISDAEVPPFDTAGYDFRVVDTASELHALIEERNGERNRSRVVAGYCWNWMSKKDPTVDDIVLDDGAYRRKWNLAADGNRWIIADDSINEVGCIHTSQGLELDYVGVIIGDDLRMGPDGPMSDVTRRARTDHSVRGLTKVFPDPKDAQRAADEIIRNTYRTLMTRGMKGCYVHCTDPALADYFRAQLASLTQEQPDAMVVPLVPRGEREAGRRYAPVIDIAIAAGAFSETQVVDEAEAWVEVGADGPRSLEGVFAARVVGESMNNRIPNGSLCLFRLNPTGTRQGRVVVAQHSSITDPEHGGSFTVKVYSSEKAQAEDGTWSHTRIVLRPDSEDATFEPIVLTPEALDDESVRVIAEWVPPALGRVDVFNPST